MTVVYLKLLRKAISMRVSWCRPSQTKAENELTSPALVHLSVPRAIEVHPGLNRTLLLGNGRFPCPLLQKPV